MKLSCSLLATVVVMLATTAFADPDAVTIQNAKDAFFADAGWQNLNGRETWKLESVTPTSFVMIWTHRPPIKQGVPGQQPNANRFSEHIFDGDWSTITSVKAVKATGNAPYNIAITFNPPVTMRGVLENVNGEYPESDYLSEIQIPFLTLHLINRFVARFKPLLQQVAPSVKIDLTVLSPPNK